MKRKIFLLLLIVSAAALSAIQSGCDNGGDDDSNAGDGDTDSDSDQADTDSETDSETDAYNVPGPEWANFGTACKVDSDCSDYPSDEKRCIQNCMGIINVPNGYCTACCNEKGHDKCAPGIDCVGETGVYLVCLAHCKSDEDCRQAEGYECREIYYIPEQFPGKYCLPKPELVTPDSDDNSTLVCPWPW